MSLHWSSVMAPSALASMSKMASLHRPTAAIPPFVGAKIHAQGDKPSAGTATKLCTPLAWKGHRLGHEMSPVLFFHYSGHTIAFSIN